MFSSFSLPCSCIETLDTEFDNLEKLLVSCPISRNVICYTTKKAEVKEILEKIHGHFASSLKEINKLS